MAGAFLKNFKTRPLIEDAISERTSVSIPTWLPDCEVGNSNILLTVLQKLTYDEIRRIMRSRPSQEDDLSDGR